MYAERFTTLFQRAVLESLSKPRNLKTHFCENTYISCVYVVYKKLGLYIRMLMRVMKPSKP